MVRVKKGRVLRMRVPAAEDPDFISLLALVHSTEPIVVIEGVTHSRAVWH